MIARRTRPAFVSFDSVGCFLKHVDQILGLVCLVTFEGEGEVTKTTNETSAIGHLASGLDLKPCQLKRASGGVVAKILNGDDVGRIRLHGPEH